MMSTLTHILLLLQASLMDQDLSLMKQLLTLNEEIEELKWRRRYCWSKSSFLNSSCEVASTDWSQSDMSITKMGDDLPPKYPSPSSLSLSIDDSRCSFYDDADSARTLSREQLKGSMSKMVQKIQKLERDSYDSGINEGYTETSIPVPQPLVTHLWWHIGDIVFIRTFNTACAKRLKTRVVILNTNDLLISAYVKSHWWLVVF